MELVSVGGLSLGWGTFIADGVGIVGFMDWASAEPLGRDDLCWDFVVTRCYDGVGDGKVMMKWVL